jgi:hypothetical protein
VGGEVSGGPSVEERGCVSSEFVEEIAQGKALLRVNRKILHILMVQRTSCVRSKTVGPPCEGYGVSNQNLKTQLAPP